MNDVGIGLAFYILAAVTIGSTLGVVSVRNVFHSAMYLVLSFVGVAGLYITLSADFVAAVQILIYAGAVAILLVFAVMLTHSPETGSPTNQLRGPALFVAGLMLATLVMVFVNMDGSWFLSNDLPLENTSVEIAKKLLDPTNGYVLPFEVASVLLLAAMVGAIVVARED